MRSQQFIAAAPWLLFFPTLIGAACYNVDGTTTGLDDSFKPCNASAQVSTCCATNKGSNADVCLTSGLCYTQGEGYSGMIYMNGCTDKTGLSDSCAHFCPDATNNWGGGSTVRNYNILQCNKGVYCCRASSDTSNCCSNSSAIISTDVGRLLLATATATATTTTTIGTGTAASAMTSTALASAGASAGGNSTSIEENASCPPDKSAVVGGAVGGALGAALLASLGALAFVLMRRRSAAAGSIQEYNHSQYAMEGGNHVVGSDFPQAHTKQDAYRQGGQAPPTELPVERDRAEM